MQRNSVDLPRPLAATRPIRSPALMARLRFENSGLDRVTPRLRILIRDMVVFRSFPSVAGARPSSIWAGMRIQACQAQGLVLRATRGRPGRGIVFEKRSLVSPANASAG